MHQQLQGIFKVCPQQCRHTQVLKRLAKKTHVRRGLSAKKYVSSYLITLQSSAASKPHGGPRTPPRGALGVAGDRRPPGAAGCGRMWKVGVRLHVSPCDAEHGKFQQGQWFSSNDFMELWENNPKVQGPQDVFLLHPDTFSPARCRKAKEPDFGICMTDQR